MRLQPFLRSRLLALAASTGVVIDKLVRLLAPNTFIHNTVKGLPEPVRLILGPESAFSISYD